MKSWLSGQHQMHSESHNCKSWCNHFSQIPAFHRRLSRKGRLKTKWFCWPSLCLSSSGFRIFWDFQSTIGGCFHYYYTDLQYVFQSKPFSSNCLDVDAGGVNRILLLPVRNILVNTRKESRRSVEAARLKRLSAHYSWRSYSPLWALLQAVFTAYSDWRGFVSP